MSTTDFARLLTRYLSQHLPAQRSLSSHTIESYRDTFKLLLRFGHEERGWEFEYITLSQIDRSCIEAFLDWLESSRHSSVATRNQRLAALRAFFRWVSYEAPESIEMTQRILGIPLSATSLPLTTWELMDEFVSKPDAAADSVPHALGSLGEEYRVASWILSFDNAPQFLWRCQKTFLHSGALMFREQVPVSPAMAGIDHEPAL